MLGDIVRVENNGIYISTQGREAGQSLHVVHLAIGKGRFRKDAVIALANRDPKQVHEDDIQLQFSERTRDKLHPYRPFHFYDERGRRLRLIGDEPSSKELRMADEEGIPRQVRILKVFTLALERADAG